MWKKRKRQKGLVRSWGWKTGEFYTNEEKERNKFYFLADLLFHSQPPLIFTLFVPHYSLSLTHFLMNLVRYKKQYTYLSMYAIQALPATILYFIWWVNFNKKTIFSSGVTIIFGCMLYTVQILTRFKVIWWICNCKLTIPSCTYKLNWLVDLIISNCIQLKWHDLSY